MIQFYETSIQSVAIHLVGNKNNDEYVKYSHSVLGLDKTTKDVLMNYLSNRLFKSKSIIHFAMILT